MTTLSQHIVRMGMRFRMPLAPVGLQQVLFQLVGKQKGFPQDRLEATLSREGNQRKADFLLEEILVRIESRLVHHFILRIT